MWEERLANATALRRLRRRIFSFLPFPVMRSDVRDVVYASWLIPTERVRAIVPQDVALAERDGHTLLTILTYRHGHFGPAFFGPLRRLCGSPCQSNWRLYLAEESGRLFGHQHMVLFIRNSFNSLLYTLGTRLFTDILPSRRESRFIHRCADGVCETELRDEQGAPAFRLKAEAKQGPSCNSIAADLPADFIACFGTWDAAVRFITLQQGALAVVADEAAIACSQIDLPVDIATAMKLECVEYAAGAWLRGLVGQAMPFCFYVPQVRFRALTDRLVGPA